MLANIIIAETKAMSLTIDIYYTDENGNARKFAEEMEQSGTASAIKAEKSNLKYEYFYPVNDKEIVLIIGSRENQEAIDVYHTTPMINKIIMELRDKYNLHMRVERDVSDEQGVPSQNKEFIRQ